MRGLPIRGASEENITGFSCPACHGVLEVEFAPNDKPVLFVCRIGHRFTSADLLIETEERVERLLWAALTAYEELSTLLTDLSHLNEPLTSSERYESRLASISTAIKLVRSLVDENRPIVLEAEAPNDQGPR